MSFSVDAREELRIAGLKYTMLPSGDARVLCPFHEDSIPSCDVSSKGVFVCRSCKAKGGLHKLLARVTGKADFTVLAALRDKYDEKVDKIIEAGVVEKWHQAIWSHEHFLNELHKRAVTDDLIRFYRIGADDGRIMIPIVNHRGLYVNARKYLPGSARKFLSQKSRGRARLYPLDQLKYSRIMVCGGELKAIVAANQLNPHGIGAICLTCGEGNWDPSFNDFFADKEAVYVCLDVDDAGRVAAKAICGQLFRFAQTLFNVVLPIKVDKGDINDFAAAGGQLIDLIDVAKPYEPQQLKSTAKAEPSPMSLCATANHIDRRFLTRAAIAAVDTGIYSVPSKVQVNCTRDQPVCGICPIAMLDADLPEIEIDSEDGVLLAIMDSPIEIVGDKIRQSMGIPKCKSVSITPVAWSTATDARLQNEIDVTELQLETRIVPAVFIGTDPEINGTYEIIGKSVPHPKTQRHTLIVSSSKAVQDSLTGFVVDASIPLQMFQPTEWTVESIEERLNIVYTDFDANVTRVFDRREILTVADLTYHSVLGFKIDGQQTKGWLDTIILGDSSTAKSQTILQLQAHYKLGERVDSKNATRAGILGGVEQLAGKHFVTWGVIPRHDRRLVILEELKGMPQEVFASLTDMRSSGIAEIPKIRRGRTLARTRLISVSNPRSDSPMSAYGFGVDALKELIGSLEDIRRFDASILVNREDVDITDLQTRRPKCEHVYTSELSRHLVLWAWTRRSEQVVFEDERHILETASRLCNQYSDDIPILDRGSSRFKIARLAAAVAARTYSTDETGEQLIVRRCHVDWVAKWLHETYSKTSHGYLRYSDHRRAESQLVDSKAVTSLLRKTPSPVLLKTRMLALQRIEIQDVMDWCSYDRDEALDFIAMLVRNNALKREKRWYVKTEALVRLFAGFDTSIPQHIKLEDALP